LRSVENILKGFGQWVSAVKTWEEVVDGQYAIVGSPATVLEKLEGSLERLGTGNLLGLFQLATLPADLTRNSTELFARDVMPRLRERFGTDAALAVKEAV
jgi:alkanesulfonate monooxygenase SsuD/methylene tetrahydromethanopterin reductase-like flavin-dependent oxidoreductase (luciferase family)